jgi:uncharacterized protein GlcG (DUF336 family)
MFMKPYQLFCIGLLRRWMISACALLALVVSGQTFAACTPEDSVARLSSNEVTCIVNQAVESAQRLSQTQMTVAVVDRVGNVLAVYRLGTASAVQIRSGLFADATVRGLDGSAFASGGGGDALAAISKAVTGAYLSSSGNAFSTRTASFIVQNHFPPLIRNAPGGPLFGVQFSQLQCGDLVNTTSGSSLGVGPRPAPLGLSADPGGFPLYKNGVVVGGIGVVAGVTSTYGLDLNPDPKSLDFDIEETIAQSASIGFVAPTSIRADRITAGGITLRYSDSDNRILGSLASTISPALRSDGALTPVTNFFSGSAVRPGKIYGEAGSGFSSDFTGGFPGLFILTDNSGTTQRFPASAGGTFSGQQLLSAEVRTLINSALTVARTARAQIRKPDGSFAQVTVSVVDSNGTILGIARTADAPIFGTDVSLQKARTAAFFSKSSAASHLNSIFPAVSGGNSRYVLDTRAFFGNTNSNALANGVAISARALGNIARPNFPDGIDGKPRGPMSNGVNWSPFNVGIQLDMVASRILNYGAGQCTTAAVGANNGIQIFPGGVPIYKNGVLVGGIGASGDGIDQDDMIVSLGLARAGIPGVGHAPASQRVKGLKYFQCPQAPFLNSKANNVCDGL